MTFAKYTTIYLRADQAIPSRPLSPPIHLPDAQHKRLLLLQSRCYNLRAGAPAGYQAYLIWVLLVLSVICTSALHQFAPFRLDAIMMWPEIPPHLNILKYNFILTAGSLLVVLILAVFYWLGRKSQAVTGLVILAIIMLVPNDNCPNDFNLPWMQWIGASPLMFMPNSVVLLIGYLGLHGIWPRIGILLMAGINVSVLLLGLGHLTRLIW